MQTGGTDTTQTIGETYTSLRKSRGGGSSGPSVGDLTKSGQLQEEIQKEQRARQEAQAKRQQEIKDQEQRRKEAKEQARKETAAQQALILYAGRQIAPGSKKFEELRSKRIREKSLLLDQPKDTRVLLAGGRLEVSGIVGAKAPKGPTAPPVDQRVRKDGFVLDDKGFIDFSKKQDLAKVFNVTDQVTIELPPEILAKFPKKANATISGRKPKYGKSISDPIKFTRVDYSLNLQDTKNPLKKLALTHKFLGDLGTQYIKKDEYKIISGGQLLGAGLIFHTKASETAYQVSPIGIGETLATRGVEGTFSAYTFEPAQAIISGKILKQESGIGRLAEASGIAVGAIVGGSVTKGTLKFGAQKVHAVNWNRKVKAMERAQTEKLVNHGEVILETQKGFFRKQFREGSFKFDPRQQQQVLADVTESGKVIQRFGDNIPKLERTIINLRKGKVRQFDPVKSPLKTSVKIPKPDINTLKTSGRTGTQVKLNLKGKTTRPYQFQEFKFSGNVWKDNRLSTTQKVIKELKIDKFLKDETGQVLVPPKLVKPSFKFDFPKVKSRAVGTTGRLNTFALLPPFTIYDELQEQETRFNFKLDVVQDTKPKEDVQPILKITSIEDLKPDTKTRLNALGGYRSGSAPKIDTKPKAEQDTFIIVPPIPDVITDQTPAQRGRFRTPKIPKPTQKTPPVALIKFQDKKVSGASIDVFDVFGRKAGKFLKINLKPLPKGKAFNLGARTIDTTPQATFKLELAGQGPKVADEPIIGKSKFYKKKDLFIELSKFRIDTPGEFTGITLKGINTKGGGL